jgi:hypothetical protein
VTIAPICPKIGELGLLCYLSKRCANASGLAEDDLSALFPKLATRWESEFRIQQFFNCLNMLKLLPFVESFYNNVRLKKYVLTIT